MAFPLTSTRPVVDLPPYRLLCDIPVLAEEIKSGLGRAGWRPTAGSTGLTLLVDAPRGFALRHLTRDGGAHMVVVTDNPCPEYWEDLWALGPQALLAGGHTAPDVANALERVARGKTFRQVPPHDSTLTALERQLLHFSAMGWNNPRIAATLQRDGGTVRNGLSRVFHKLGLERVWSGVGRDW